MKVTLMRDANKLYSDHSAYECHKRKIADAEYKPMCLDEEEFRNLVFMWTNNYSEKVRKLDFGQNERVLGQKTRERENGTEKGTGHCLVLNNGRLDQ